MEDGRDHLLVTIEGQLPASLVEQAVMDEESMTGPHRPCEVEGFLHSRPWTMGWASQDVDSSRSLVQLVTGMEEDRAESLTDEVPDVADRLEIPMDDRVMTTHSLDPYLTELQHVTWRDGIGVKGRDLVARTLLSTDDGPGVGVDQSTNVIRINVIGVAMGDEDGVQAGQPVPSLAEVARVDEDPLPGCFDEDAGVPQMRDSHVSSVPPPPADGNQFSDIRR